MGKAAPEDFAAMVRGDILQQGTDYAQIRVNLLDKHLRKVKSHAIAQNVYSELSEVRNKFLGTRIKLFETPPGPPVRSQMEAGLFGPNYTLLQNLGSYIVDNIYPNIYGMINIDDSVTQNVTEYNLIIDRNKAVMQGLVPAELAEEVQIFCRNNRG